VLEGKKMKKACITGITGQIGSYLAEHLLEKGYEVHGLIRRSSSFNTGRIDHIFNDLHLTYGDLSDYGSIANWVKSVQPEELYQLSAMSHVQISFLNPEYTTDIDCTGQVRCLEALANFSPHTKMVFMATSELYGSTPPPQNEQTPFHPRSPYAAAKLGAYWATVNYRESGKLFASNAIVFNSESPRRGETFVTRKITRAATRIKLGLQDKLALGNTKSFRSWNHAKDTCLALNLMATADNPDDFVVCGNKMHSVQEFVELVFNKLDLNWEDFVVIDPKYFRPTEVDALQGDSTKIMTQLGWKPKYTFEQLVDEMVASDMKLAEKELMLKGK
jgi:GDPmannose 4,6-dehydratase